MIELVVRFKSAPVCSFAKVKNQVWTNVPCWSLNGQIKEFLEFSAIRSIIFMSSSRSQGFSAEMGQYQILVQYQYQYFLKFCFQYQDPYQYCPWEKIKIKMITNINIFPNPISRSRSIISKILLQYQYQHQYLQYIDIDIENQYFTSQHILLKIFVTYLLCLMIKIWKFC